MTVKHEPRRKFIYLATASFAMAGGAAALWPLIAQMNPPEHMKPEEIEIDLSPIGEGETAGVKWDGLPVHIRHRTAGEIEAARRVSLDALIDRDARLIGAPHPLPASDANRTKPGHEMWLVVAAICTHEACLLSGLKPGETRGDFGGWFCPCCAAHYDTSGRTRSGIARRNLAVPPYRFTGPSRIAIMPASSPAGAYDGFG
jgi:ubiquinol-cytochrome c reductase iron-sulfur subunit